MTTEIPTYEIGIPSDVSYTLKMPDYLTPIELTPDDGYNGVTTIDYAGEKYAPRIYANPVIATASLLYGPGSARYEVVHVETDDGADHAVNENLVIDPKTYVDAYGYIHLGRTNRPTAEMGAEGLNVLVRIKPTYHYINPTTGTEVVKTLSDNATLNIAFTYTPYNQNEVMAENERSIPYNLMPSDRLGLD